MTTLAELGEIAKSERKPPKGYRRSYLSDFNPRSETFVREGTGIQRLGGPALGGAITGVVGVPQVGSSLGLTRNIKSGDTISYHRRTGKKAKLKLDTGVGYYNVYGRGKKSGRG